MMKVRHVVKLLSEDGWIQVSQSGSHRQFKHPTKPGRVTIAGKPGDEIAPGTLRSIARQSGIKVGRP
jgi:predicted RNA binding protein YcfA (HicA-like mRNA interferase family)